MLELLRKRRSIRAFKARAVEAEKIEQLCEVLVRAPTSRGRKPWEFVIVTDRGLLNRLGEAKEHGSGFLAGAPLAVAVCADPQRSDVWIEDCAIAAILLQMSAEALGLGSCWAQIRLRDHGDGRTAEEYVREILGLPGELAVAAIVGIGYPAEEKPSHPPESLPWRATKLGRSSPQQKGLPWWDGSAAGKVFALSDQLLAPSFRPLVGAVRVGRS
jgi:nitroreductase